MPSGYFPLGGETSPSYQCVWRVWKTRVLSSYTGRPMEPFTDWRLTPVCPKPRYMSPQVYFNDWSATLGYIKCEIFIYTAPGTPGVGILPEDTSARGVWEMGMEPQTFPVRRQPVLAPEPQPPTHGMTHWFDFISIPYPDTSFFFLSLTPLQPWWI